MSTLEVHLLVAARLDYIEELLAGVRVLVMGGSGAEAVEASRRKAEKVTWVHTPQEHEPPTPLRYSYPRMVEQVASRSATGLPAESFDVVICSDLSFTEADLRAQLAEIRRLLHPDGFLYLTLPPLPPARGDGDEGRDLIFIRSELRRFFPNVETLSQQIFTGVMVGPDARSLPTWRTHTGEISSLTITLCSRLLIVLEEQMLQLHPLEKKPEASIQTDTPDVEELAYLREQARLAQQLSEEIYHLDKERPHQEEVENLRSEVRALRSRAERGDTLALELEEMRQALAQGEQRWNQSQIQLDDEGEEVDTLRTRQEARPPEIEELVRELQSRDERILEQARELQALRATLQAEVGHNSGQSGERIPDEIWSPPADTERPQPADGGGALWQEMLSRMESESQGWETPQESNEPPRPPQKEEVDEWESGPTPLGDPREEEEHLSTLEDPPAPELPPLPDSSPASGLQLENEGERDEDVDMSEVFTISAFWNEVDRSAPTSEKPPEPPQEGELALLKSIADDKLAHLPRVTRRDGE